MTSRHWFWLPLVVPILIGLARLRFDVEVLDLLPPNLPAVQGLKLYQQHFANARELLITIRAPDAEQAEAAARTIAERLRLQTNLVTDALWEPPWREHPGQSAELLAYLWLNQSPELFADLDRRLSPDKLAAALAETREGLATSMSPADIARSSYDPFGFTRLPESVTDAAPSFGQGQEMFASPDGTFRIIFVQANRDLTTYRDCARWLKEIRASVNEALGALPLPFGKGEGRGERSASSPRFVGSEASGGLPLPGERAGVRGNSGVPDSGMITGNLSLGYTGRPAFVAEVATGMERDITTSVGGTSVIIAILFWLAHRRWKPMLWLLTLLALILGGTLALGGLIFGTISVISTGFAAILLGLAVDYAVVHYQEALAHPTLTVPEIRRAIAPSIFWAAVTSISAFLVLNFGGLPGLAQLGSLVAVGIGLSACVMIFAFLPPLFPDRRGPRCRDTETMTSALPRPTDAKSAACDSPSPWGEGRGEGELPRFEPSQAHGVQPISSHTQHVQNPARRFAKTVFFVTSLLLLLSLVVLSSGLPRMDSTANALRPRNSSSYAALEAVKRHLNQNREPLWLLVGGRTANEVARRLDEVSPTLTRAVSNHLIADFKLPTPLWPRPEFQATNRFIALSLTARRNAFREAALTNGFAEPSLGLTTEILNVWQRAGQISGVFWPTNPMSQWIFQEVVARSPTNYFALGFINPTTNTPALVQNEATTRSTNSPSPRPSPPGRGGAEARRLGDGDRVSSNAAALSSLESQLPHNGVLLSGWELLGNAIFSSVKQNMWKLVFPIIGLILLSLWLAFRRSQEVLLSLAVLALSALCLLTVMRFAGWSWNLLNLMALPLILGTGVDYSIFMQLALRRYHGDLGMAYRSVGRALLLCGATAIAGFGSLAWSSNAGMASLGAVCAVGIAGNMLISVLLLPNWWKTVEAPNSKLQAPEKFQAPSSKTEPSVEQATGNDEGGISGPSILYCSLIWRLGLGVVRLLPEKVCARLGRLLAGCYQMLAPHRREVLVQNLLPVTSDPTAARETAKKLFDQFADKLVDLWRFEAGLPIDHMFGEFSGWQNFLDAQAQKRGILLVTPHIGNWEFGGVALSQQGVRLQVVTLAEPGRNFTRLRLDSRARRDIETIVIGNDPFVFVDIIRRLEAGANIALLVDRPSPTTRVTVELFGRRFAASISAAELARASGCVVLPVYMLRTAHGYCGSVLPAISYDRAGLRDRQARQQFTQEIMRAFEPVIRQHPDQWFHFVPIWNSVEKHQAHEKHQAPTSKLQ